MKLVRRKDHVTHCRSYMGLDLLSSNSAAVKLDQLNIHDKDLEFEENVGKLKEEFMIVFSDGGKRVRKLYL